MVRASKSNANRSSSSITTLRMLSATTAHGRTFRTAFPVSVLAGRNCARRSLPCRSRCSRVQSDYNVHTDMIDMITCDTYCFVLPICVTHVSLVDKGSIFVCLSTSVIADRNYSLAVHNHREKLASET